MTNIDECPECGEPLEFDEIDVGVGVLKGNPSCPGCHWSPGAARMPCECGCGRTSYAPGSKPGTSMLEFNHPEDYRYERG